DRSGARTTRMLGGNSHDSSSGSYPTGEAGRTEGVHRRFDGLLLLATCRMIGPGHDADQPVPGALERIIQSLLVRREDQAGNSVHLDRHNGHWVLRGPLHVVAPVLQRSIQ